jgi:ribosome biogenesis protein MAK21
LGPCFEVDKYTRPCSGKFPSTIEFPERKFELRENSPNSSTSRIMGKKRKRTAKDPESASSAVQLPSFDESALSALTNKIESGFRKTAAPRQDPRDRNPLPSENPRNRIERAQKSKSNTQDRLSGNDHHAQGIVREQSAGGSKIPKSRADRRNGQKEDEQNILLQEILALGGTEDDLDLVMGVASDDEDIGENGLEQTSAIDHNLTKELSKYIIGLGINTQDIEDPSGTESAKDVDDESEDALDTSKSKVTKAVKDVKNSDLQGSNGIAKRLKDLVSKFPPLEAGNVVLTEALDV